MNIRLLNAGSSSLKATLMREAAGSVAAQGMARLAEGRTKIVGAVYEIETGGVRFLASE